MKTKKQIWEFIARQKVAFIGSIDDEGFPNMKCMYAPRKAEGNSFYFTTNLSAMRTGQFMKNPKASIYFYKKGRFQYEGVMLTGTMEVLQDPKTKEEIWRPGDTMYYREGVTDPDYCVLKFTAQAGRHYSALKTESFTVEELELGDILETFASSGWDLIAAPSKAYLKGKGDRELLSAALRQAEAECGSCGCDMDPLYIRALELLENRDS